MTEFDLIEKFFVRDKLRSDVEVGIGDDAAVCNFPHDSQLVLTTDLFIAGVHFPERTPAEAIGHKALAINLSDLAAMGATPAWFTLNLSLPEIDEDWLQNFSQGMKSLADVHRVDLVGGDTVKGPLGVSIQVCGYIPTGTSVLRSGARAGDKIYVTGCVGDAALGLRSLSGSFDISAEAASYFVSKLNTPVPRVEQGIALRGIASAMTDISDGLAADLGHILTQSGVGASIAQESLPLSQFYRDNIEAVSFDGALTGGDDYELCFTVPENKIDEFKAASGNWQCGVTCIGEVERAGGLRINDANGKIIDLEKSGYDHFANYKNSQT